MTTPDLRTLERAVALTIDFLRALPEDLRVAAIAASADDQPRRAATLDRHMSSSRQLAYDLGLAWADVAGLPPKASISVDMAVKRDQDTSFTVAPRFASWVGDSLRKVADDVAPMNASRSARARVRSVNLVERSANDLPPQNIRPDSPSREPRVWWSWMNTSQRWTKWEPDSERDGHPAIVTYDANGHPIVEQGSCSAEELAALSERERKCDYSDLVIKWEPDILTAGASANDSPVERPSLAPPIYRRGSVALRLYAGAPESVLSALFTIADSLGLEGDKDWTLDDIVREVRELASDAVHNDEQGRALVPIVEVCEALGLSSVSREGLHGAEVEVPLDRLMLLTRARALREALATAMQASVEGTRATVRTIEVVEDGLTRKLAERLAVVDREWLEALMDGAS